MPDTEVAFVTGAGSGIGRATALRLAARGARLALFDISAAGLAETAAAIRPTGLRYWSWSATSPTRPRSRARQARRSSSLARFARRSPQLE